MTKATRVQDYLRHILQAIERIERYTVGMNEAEFLGHEMAQDAVLRNIEILGEQHSARGSRICRAAARDSVAGHVHDA